MKKTVIICVTIVLLVGIGSLVYIQKQTLSQKDKQFQQQQAINAKNAAESVKKLKYQECEDTNRQAFGDPTTFSSLRVENCDLIL